MTNSDLESRILLERGTLRGFIAKRAGGLRRFEDVEDLVQDTLLRAFSAAKPGMFATDAELRAWLFTIAAHHMTDRRAHWQALKRGSARVARITLSGLSGEGVMLPAIDQSGPGTRAARRELLVITARALETLPERDRKLVRWKGEGMPLQEQAQRLEMTYPAAQKASLRAFERFKKLFELAMRRRSAPEDPQP